MSSAVRRGLFVAPFDDLADARLLAELAQDAERAGFAGFFLWDHVAYRAPVGAILDPWICLTAIAVATERVVIGPLVTPLARRRIPKLARETATLDRLSGGRLVLGAGLGSDRSGEFELPGEEPDPRVRAQALDDGLAELQRLWSGAFEPQPVGQIPIWLAARWPNRRPVRRAARFDGLFPIDMPGPEALAELRSEVPPPPFDLIVTNPPGTDLEPWSRAGATWCLTGFDSQPREADVRAAIADGP
jgi:alkanesulfonate monooxygenase SsuD/methylene tetrahydromethanopterin reductase-like flavin-dependent oxidoreductase (luciferase family)